MKRNFLYSLILGILFIIFHSACNDPTVIGSDLLVDDQLDINFTDTVTLRSYNTREDSIITFNPSALAANNENFPLGIFDDPIFGVSSSEVYTEMTLNFSFPDFDESGAELDSVVLVLPFNAKGSYGDLEDLFTLEVYQLLNEFPDDTLFSNMEFETDRLIGTYEYTPAVNDSVEIELPGQDSTVKLPPQIRIPLDQNMFGRDLFAIDTPYSNNVAEFESFLKGLLIKPTSVNKGMPSFNFRGNNAGIRVYYHLDTAYSDYLFPIFPNNVVTAKYTHDYSPSVIDIDAQFVGENAPVTDSLLFLQGMSGINFVIEVPYSENLSDKVLNKAEIVFPIQYLPEDDLLTYLPVDQIIVSELQDDGTLALIDDVIFARNREGFDDFQNLFGGDQEPDDTYKVNITTHLQDMSRGLVTEKMVVTLFLKSEQAARVVLAGPGNADAPAKLRLTFTNF